MRILFVCTGNTCRSPMAEKILRKMAEEQELDIEIRSAGTYAFSGSPASVNATRVLAGRGIHEPHEARMVSPELVEWATLILTMTRSHKGALLQAYPEMAEKIYTLKEYTQPDSLSGDIGDPFGGSLEVYERCAREIRESLEELIRNLIQQREDGDLDSQRSKNQG